MLAGWARTSETWWRTDPSSPERGCYGTGYNHWGYHTNLKYMAAMAVLSERGAGLADVDVAHCRRRALASLRWALDRHLTGSSRLLDGEVFGNSWISALAWERAMHGVYLLEPHLSDADRNALRRLLVSEADWLTDQYEIVADPWNQSGHNKPESNLWNGALCWRTAAMYSDHPRAEVWRQRAHDFFINGVSIPADAEDSTPVAGKPLKQRFRGANFFPHFALDHHGYLNVGYMVICVSNAAILHFDLRGLKAEAPASLHHHQRDLWQVLRRMIFTDGRLARIGGDTRVRYAYCQEFLLPSLLYAADHLGDPDALAIVPKQIELMRREYDANADGTFYGRRLEAMKAWSPYYYCRIESDRASALAQAVVYAERVLAPTPAPSLARFEQSAEGGWSEPQHGAALHRGPARLASFSWRAFGLGQGMGLTPDNGDDAEWSRNLGGYVRFIGGDDPLDYGLSGHRRLLRNQIRPFDGGFLTWGAIAEGVDAKLDDGWKSPGPAAIHQIVFAALPDGHTVVGMQFARALYRAWTSEIKGLHLNLPNDVLQDMRRTIVGPKGEMVLHSPPQRDEVVSLGGLWCVIGGRVGVAGLYGAPLLSLSRLTRRRGGKYRTLYVDELCYPCDVGTHPVEPGQTILDCAWMVRTDMNAESTAQWSEAHQAAPRPWAGHARAVEVIGADDRRYLLACNFGESSATIDGVDRELPAGEAILQPLR